MSSTPGMISVITKFSSKSILTHCRRVDLCKRFTGVRFSFYESISRRYSSYSSLNFTALSLPVLIDSGRWIWLTRVFGAILILTKKTCEMKVQNVFSGLIQNALLTTLPSVSLRHDCQLGLNDWMDYDDWINGVWLRTARRLGTRGRKRTISSLAVGPGSVVPTQYSLLVQDRPVADLWILQLGPAIGLHHYYNVHQCLVS